MSLSFEPSWRKAVTRRLGCSSIRSRGVGATLGLSAVCADSAELERAFRSADSTTRPDSFENRAAAVQTDLAVVWRRIVLTKASESMGLAIWSIMPEARQAAFSSAKA